MFRNKKNIFLVSLLVIYIIFIIMNAYSGITSTFSNLINPLFLFALFITSIISTLDETYRVRKKKDKVKTIIIVVLFYYIVYFTLGLVFGFSLSPYSRELNILFRNVFLLIIGTFFIEYYRITIIKYAKINYFTFPLIAILFFLANPEVYLLVKNSGVTEELFKSSFEFIIPMFLTSVLLTNLALKGGFWSSFSYSLMLNIVFVISPIFPNLNWFLTFTLKLLLTAGVFFAFSYYDNDPRDIVRKKDKKHDLMSTIVLLFFVSMFSLFVVGVFKYMPIAVMSNSMQPVFERGDIIIVEKVENVEKVEVSSIIKYRLGNSFIVHRVVSIIETDNEKLFVTKGDNNEAEDALLVKEEQISGIVHKSVKYIGYPSVWISEVLRKPKPDVEM